MTNCEWLLKENKLEEFMHDYTSLVIYLSTRDIAKDLTGLEEIDKFREKYPTCHPIGHVTLVLNVSQWLMSEKEVNS